MMSVRPLFGTHAFQAESIPQLHITMSMFVQYSTSGLSLCVAKLSFLGLRAGIDKQCWD